MLEVENYCEGTTTEGANIVCTIHPRSRAVTGFGIRSGHTMRSGANTVSGKYCWNRVSGLNALFAAFKVCTPNNWIYSPAVRVRTSIGAYVPGAPNTVIVEDSEFPELSGTHFEEEGPSRM